MTLSMVVVLFVVLAALGVAAREAVEFYRWTVHLRRIRADYTPRPRFPNRA